MNSLSDDVAIKVENVSKTFRLPHEKQRSIKGQFINFLRTVPKTEEQIALKNISFDIKKGEFFGIVGRNGSGKSTLLKLLAGIYIPNKGTINVTGKITPFIELGVGFNPELTGKENVYLNGALLGFSRADVNGMYDDIVGFAELEKFMDQKLKNYSSGMQVRLAFSIAIRAKTPILLIDEVLAVGDAAFQAKCFDYFHKLKKSDTTIVFVSHDRSALERFCDRGILINEGEIIEQGHIRDVLKEYTSIVLDELNRSDHTHAADVKNSKDWVEIFDVKTIDHDKKTGNTYNYGEMIAVSFKAKIKKEITNPIIGITIWKKNVDYAIYATNTLIASGKESGEFKKGQVLTMTTVLPKNLNDGEYIIEPAVANYSATVFYDQVPEACKFIISGSKNPYSIVATDNKVDIKIT